MFPDDILNRIGSLVRCLWRSLYFEEKRVSNRKRTRAVDVS